MKNRILLAGFLSIILLSCDPGTTTTNNGTPDNGQIVEQPKETWICVPNERVGLITARSDEKDIIKSYGQENVVRREVGYGDSREMMMATIVFPDSPNELIVEWQEDFAFQKISRIRIEQENAQWKTLEGIMIGTTLDSLVSINGKDFNFYGFEWEDGGMANDWDGGNINRQLVVSLVPGDPEKIFPDLLGEGTFSSADPKAKEAQLSVFSMTIFFGL